MPRPTVKRKETLYTSFVVLVCGDDYIVTHLDGFSLVVLDAELAEGDIKEGILAPLTIVFKYTIVSRVIYARFVCHTNLARFWETIYLR